MSRHFSDISPPTMTNKTPDKFPRLEAQQGADQRLQLKERPDGLGYIYGQVQQGKNSIRVDIMPPVGLWNGDIVPSDLDGSDRRDQSRYIVYLDGEEVARVARLETVTADFLDAPTSDPAKEVEPAQDEVRGRFAGWFDGFKK